MQSNKLTILYIGNKLAVHGRTPTGIDTLGPLLEQEGYTLLYSSSKENKLSRLMDMLWATWRNRNIADVVLIDTYSTAAFYFAWICGLLCTMLHLKYIPILHGGNLPERFKNSPRKCRQLFGNSFMNVTVSGYLQEHLEKSGFRGISIANTIELQKYPFKERNTTGRKILWVRAFHETYDPDLAILAFELYNAEYPGAQLAMVGPDLDGSMERSRKLAKEKGLEKQVKFTGKLAKEEWIALSTQYDVFINTSNFDNQPVTILEAMALGLPVISTNVGGVPYMIVEGENGLLIPRNDAGALCAGLIRLTTDASIAKKLSLNGRNFAEQFDWNIIKHKWEQLFSSVN